MMKYVYSSWFKLDSLSLFLNVFNKIFIKTDKSIWMKYMLSYFVPSRNINYRHSYSHVIKIKEKLVGQVNSRKPIVLEKENSSLFQLSSYYKNLKIDMNLLIRKTNWEFVHSSESENNKKKLCIKVLGSNWSFPKVKLCSISPTTQSKLINWRCFWNISTTSYATHR